MLFNKLQEVEAETNKFNRTNAGGLKDLSTDNSDNKPG